MSGNLPYVVAFQSLSKRRRTRLLSRLADNIVSAIASGTSTALLELAQMGMELDPDRSWWAYTYAEALRLAGRVAEAEKVFLRVHGRRTSDRHLVEIRLGLLYRDSGRFTKAEQ